MKELTPVEQGSSGVWYKREDKYAPWGQGFINGSKLRQATWLIREAKRKGYKGICSGAVIGSPQHPMVTYVAKEEGLPHLIVTGASKVSDHPMTKMAADMGADFELSKVGYARTLNTIASRLARKHRYFHLETNITVESGINTSGRVRDFHEVGSWQAENIPDHITDVYIPAGSCNSATSAMMGIERYRPKSLKNIVLFGIGNYGTSDPFYISKRLGYLGVAEKRDYQRYYDFNTSGNPDSRSSTPKGMIRVTRHDLNGTGYCSYPDLIPHTRDGIVFHPRYEGKISKYIEEKGIAMHENTLFWIVGSEPKVK